MAANQVDFKILPSDQFSVYSPQTRSDKVITYFTLLSKLRGDILSVGQDDDPNDIVSAFYSSVGGTQTLHLVKADGSEITASVPEPTVGTVTSVNLTASTGISVSGGPITTSGSITVTNTAPDQVVVLTGAGTTSISGTYPSFTITSNDQFVGTVTSVAALTLGTTGTDLSSTVANGTTTPVITLQVPTASAANRGALSSTDWTTFNSKQGAITLTTTGTTGAATLIGATLNIPNYADQFVGTVTSVNLTASTGISVSGGPITSSGSITVTNTAPDQVVSLTGGTGITTSGTYPSFTVTNSDRGSSQNIFKNIAVAGQSTIIADDNDDTLTVVAGSGVTITTNSTTDTITISATGSGGSVTSVATTAPITGGTITTTGTIGITQSGAAADGYLSSTDWNTFNNKQNALTNPVTGTGTTNYVSKFTSSSAIGNSAIYDNASNIGIGTTFPGTKLDVVGNARMGANTSQQAFAALQVSAGEGTATTYRDIDLHGFWAAGEGHAITANYGTTTSDIVGQIVFQHDNPGSKIKFGRLYDSGNQSTYPMELVSDGGSANLTITGKVGIGTTNPTSKLYIDGGSANWNETTPGLSVGTIHLDPGVSTNDFGNAITFGASDSSNGETAQAGIYVRSDGAYGTKMYFATTDAYVAGSKTRMYISEGGSVGIGNTAPSQILHVTGNLRVTGAYYDSGNSPGTSGQILSSTVTGTSWIAAPSGGGISGSGTTNYVPKFTSASAIGNSQIFDDGTSVGIGTAVPTQKLEVNGVIESYYLEFKPVVFYDFNSDTTGDWGKANSTLSVPNDSVTRYTSTGVDSNINKSFNFDGGQNQIIRIHYKVVTGPSGGGEIFYGNSQHGYSGSYYKSFTLVSDGAWHTLVLDMSNLSSGGTDWIDYNVTSIRFDLTNVSGVAIDIDWISIGGNGYGTQYFENDVAFMNGNVGIGTTGPLAKLEVNAGAGTPAFNNGIAIVTGNSTYTTGHGGILQFQNEDVITAAIRGVRESGWGSGLALYTHNTSSGNTFGTTVVERMRITDAGNVGIGETQPASVLTVRKDSATGRGGEISIINYGGTGAGASAALNFGLEASTYDADSGNAQIKAILTGGSGITDMVFSSWTGAAFTEKIRILSGGNVGIGTTNPLFKTTISADITKDGDLTPGTAQLSLEGITTPGKRMILGYDTNGNGFGFIKAGYYGVTWTTLSLQPDGGNVGIGTTLPDKKLVVVGDGTGSAKIGIAGFIGSNYTGISLNGTLSETNYNFLSSPTDQTLYINRPTGANIRVRINNTDQIIVEAGGNVGIGITAPLSLLHVAGDARITSGSLGVGVAPNATDGRIDASNDIVAFQTSDRRLKENITPITNALEKVKSLTGVMFDWKEKTKSVHGYEGHDVGIIAQDVQAVLPEAVRTNDTGYLSVRYEKMIALLIEGMKEQQLQIDELKSKLK